MSQGKNAPGKTALSAVGPRRFDFIDFARGLAIVLALLSHALLELRLSNDLGEIGVFVRCVTRAATPAFVLIFGVMLELVYVRGVARGEMRTIAGRLIRRSFLCYLAYLATIGTELVGGKATAREAFDAVFLLSSPAYGFIFKFYMAALLLAIPLLALRVRFGIWVPVLLLGSFWLLVPFLDRIPWERAEPFGEITGLFVGKPRSPLSLLHGSFLIGLGMLLGGALRRCQAEGRMKPFAWAMAMAGSVCVIGIGLLLTRYTPWELALGQGAARNSFRMRQSGEYYLLALASSLLLLAASAWCIRPGKRSVSWSAGVFLLGRKSLLAFTVGNGLLNLMPTVMRNLSMELRLEIVVAFLATAPAAVWLAHRLHDAFWTTLAARFQRVSSAGFPDRYPNARETLAIKEG